MKKLLPTLFLLLSLFTNAQYFQGLRSSSFGGVTNVDYNPAIADNHFLVDINLIGVGMNMTNNYVGLSRDKMLHWGSRTGNLQDNYLQERVNGHDKSAVIAAQVQGPLSFMCSWGDGGSKNNNAFAFSYHINTVTNVDKFDETFARIAYLGAGTKAQSTLNYLSKGLNNVNPSAKTLTWADFDLTYSRVVYDKGDHFIKFGGTLKFLLGIAGAYAHVDNLQYKWKNFDTLSVFNSQAHYAYSQGFVTSKGYATDNYSQNVKDLFNYKYSYPSVAVDLGVIYEWRPEKEALKNKSYKNVWLNVQDLYKLSAGFSVMDLGAIRFKKGEYSGNFSATISDWRVGSAKFPDGLQSIDDTVRANFKVSPDNKNYFTMWLPTRFNLFLNYNIAYGFGLNLSSTISPNMAPNRNMVHQASVLALTPKYDYLWFGAYLPVSYDFKGNVNMGLTLRVGPLIVGMQDILGLFAKKFVYNTDVHVALKLPIPFLHPKDAAKSKKAIVQADRDLDGTPDKIDRCPDVPGPKELQGCPDSDGDGIVDMEDSCVRDKGVALFYGCPDRDSDNVQDKLDECPDLAGLPEFKGCPDRDSDGTPDKSDLCADVPGDVNHAGCPDTDHDGVYDDKDRCINTPGPKENNGCPWPDKDGDGIFDKEDECPTVYGVPENKGCPKLAKKELETLKFAFDNLEFQTGKDIITSGSYPSLNALANLLVKKETYGLRIEGHTDNVGSDERNLILSQQRATAVKTYLEKKGVSGGMLDATGYGEARPIADNDTPEGRQKNRRVEMKITFH